MIWNFLLTILVSFLGGFIAKKAHLSAPLLVGGVIAVSVFSIASSDAFCFKWVSFILQVIAGGIIGSSMTKKTLLDVRKLILPALFMVTGMFLVNYFLGNVIHWFTPIDLLTSCLSTVPGGVSETVIIADSMGAEVPTVAVMQTIRQASSLLIFPNLIRLILKHQKKEEINSTEVAIHKSTSWTWGNLLLTCLTATIGGIIGKFVTFIPASTLVFSMILTSCVNVKTNRMYIHPTLKKAAQILSGVYVGSKVTYAYFLQMQKLIIPILVLILGFTILFMLLGFLLSRIFHLELAAMLFACTPAGASDIALVAEEFSDDTSQIAVLQICRLLCVVAIFPSLLGLLSA